MGSLRYLGGKKWCCMASKQHFMHPICQGFGTTESHQQERAGLGCLSMTFLTVLPGHEKPFCKGLQSVMSANQRGTQTKRCSIACGGFVMDIVHCCGKHGRCQGW